METWPLPLLGDAARPGRRRRFGTRWGLAKIPTPPLLPLRIDLAAALGCESPPVLPAELGPGDAAARPSPAPALRTRDGLVLPLGFAVSAGVGERRAAAAAGAPRGLRVGGGRSGAWGARRGPGLSPVPSRSVGDGT